MKIHDGPCTGSPCPRTHAYKCRACQTWFRQSTVDMGGSSLRPHPFYPYCSENCAKLASMADNGFHLFQRFVTLAMATPKFTQDFPDSDAHEEFNSLITQTKELD